MTCRINGQDVATGDIDDGRPERISVLCECQDNPWEQQERDLLFHGYCTCQKCNGTGLREETDAEYWARVEAMSPKSAEDLL